MELIDDLAGIVQRRGQKSLAEKPNHPWRETADRADELQRQHPRWSNRAIATQLGMLGRERTLYEWRRLRRTEPQK